MSWVVEISLAALCAVPMIIAERRKCEDLPLIYLLSFFLSWTIIGWIAALLWAIYGKTKSESLAVKPN